MEQIKKDLQKKRFELKRLVSELSKYRAKHTELISVYIPANFQLQAIINQLGEEAGTARNIKSTTTRKNVTAAIDKMLNHIKTYKKLPENGLVVFAGNVSDREGVMDVRSWAIEPFEPINVKIYKCDQTFFLDPLKELLEVKVVFGLIVMDRREASIALLKGKQIIPVWSAQSFVPGKFKVGGQSAARLSRAIEGMAKDWYSKVGEAINKIFSQEKVKGIIIGGPGPTKEELIAGNYIRTDIKKQIIAVKATGYTGDFGLKELVERSEDVLSKEEIAIETQAMQKFLQLLAKKPAFVSYGEEKVLTALKQNAVETLLLSESLPDEKFFMYVDAAEKSGAEIVAISKESKEGQQLEGLGGVAAILRFAIQ
ncbi:MAG: peptide chain release factor aRF-1 [Candidatus Nanoarchaeia archaeon]